METEKRGKKNNELDLCIFDCTIKQKDCVFMYVVAIEDRHCLELLSFTHPYLHLRWSVQTVFFFVLYIYKYMKAFLNILTLFFIHPVQYAV